MNPQPLLLAAVLLAVVLRAAAPHTPLFFNGLDVAHDSPARQHDAPVGSNAVGDAELATYIVHTTPARRLGLHELRQMLLANSGAAGDGAVHVARITATTYHVTAPRSAIQRLPDELVHRMFPLHAAGKIAPALHGLLFPTTAASVWRPRQQEGLDQRILLLHFATPVSPSVLEGLWADSRLGGFQLANGCRFDIGRAQPQARRENGTAGLGRRTLTAFVRCRAMDAADLGNLVLWLAHLPFVRWVEPRPRFEVQNNVATVTLQSEEVATRPIWAANITGAGQIAQVGDTGLDYDSCYFRDDAQPVALYPAMNYHHRKIVSYVECDNYERLDHGDKFDAHGTHVCGSIVGNSLGSDFDRKFNGIAKDAKLVFGDLNCGDDEGVFPPGDIKDLYESGVVAGAGVSSHSWGQANTEKSYSATERNSDGFAYEHGGMLLVFAAGNYALQGIITPSSGKNMLTVGAHENSFQQETRDLMSTDSGIGPTWDNRIKPEVVGPGHAVTSAKSDGRLDSNQCSTSSKSGTSMATPLVAGSALLVRQYLVEGYYPTGVRNASNSVVPSASLLKALLVHSAVKMGAQQWPGASEGFGRVELATIMFLQQPADPIAGQVKPYTFLANNVTLRHGKARRYCFGFSPGQASPISEARATLVWMDPPSAPEGTTGTTMINDLDLAIVTPDGEVTFANGGTSHDRHNNVEVVRMAIPPVGFRNFAVIVNGHDIVDDGLYGGQPYSLVVWAPNLIVVPPEGDKVCTAFACPKNCLGRGTCHEGQCVCAAPFYGIDCAYCDGVAGCNGNAACDASTGACACSDHFDTTSDKRCGTCAAGWFGPRCDFNCECGAHGSCNRTAGRCVCDSSAEKGHWAGAHCDRCAYDWYGSSCSTPSSWCADKQVRLLAPSTAATQILQLNGEGSYSNGVRCAWQIDAGRANWKVKARLAWFDVEKTYDHLYVFDGADRHHDRRLASLDGLISEHKEFTSSGRFMSIEFVSDYVGSGNGFTIEYRVMRACEHSTCNGHGHCNADDQCECNGNFDAASDCASCLHGWTGSRCDVGTTGSASDVPAPTDEPYAPLEDSNCRMDNSTVLCSGHGWCRNSDVSCECETYYGGEFCERTCPVVGGSQCAGNGVCGEDGECLCKAEYFGRACTISQNADVQWLDPRHPIQRVLLRPSGVSYVGFRPSMPDGGTETVVVSLLATRARPLVYRSEAVSSIDALFWASAYDAESDDSATLVSGMVEAKGSVACIEVSGWSGAKLSPSLFGFRSASTNQSVLVSVAQRIIPKCGATSNSVCNASSCAAETDAATLDWLTTAAETFDTEIPPSLSPSPVASRSGFSISRATLLVFCGVIVVSAAAVVGATHLVRRVRGRYAPLSAEDGEGDVEAPQEMSCEEPQPRTETDGASNTTRGPDETVDFQRIDCDE